MTNLSYKQKAHRFFWHRIHWYILGFVLFFAPFALFTRGLGLILSTTIRPNIHAPCFRIPIQKVLSGDFIELMSVRGTSLTLLIIVSLIFGPFFCAKLCAPGGFSELISRYVPERLKIDWTRYVNPVPIRYGFLAGFILAPSITGSLACAYCSYYFFEEMMLAGFWTEMLTLGSSLILTAFLWLIVFGVFTKGGRGYCNFMCPVGTIQNFFHFLGRKFKWTYKLKLIAEQCNNCGICADECPMGALEKISYGTLIQYNVHHCLTCLQCVNSCPQEALAYGNGHHGFIQQTYDGHQPLVEEPSVMTESALKVEKE